MTAVTDDLIRYCRENGRVCPRPSQWHKLWKMLPNRSRNGVGWEPALPLILGAWAYTSNLEKMVRLEEHIKWAARHDAFEKIDSYLRGLRDSDWHHLND